MDEHEIKAYTDRLAAVAAEAWDSTGPDDAGPCIAPLLAIAGQMLAMVSGEDGQDLLEWANETTADAYHAARMDPMRISRAMATEGEA